MDYGFGIKGVVGTDFLVAVGAIIDRTTLRPAGALSRAKLSAARERRVQLLMNRPGRS